MPRTEIARRGGRKRRLQNPNLLPPALPFLEQGQSVLGDGGRDDHVELVPLLAQSLRRLVGQRPVERHDPAERRDRVGVPRPPERLRERRRDRRPAGVAVLGDGAGGARKIGHQLPRPVGVVPVVVAHVPAPNLAGQGQAQAAPGGRGTKPPPGAGSPRTETRWHDGSRWSASRCTASPPPARSGSARSSSRSTPCAGTPSRRAKAAGRPDPRPQARPRHAGSPQDRRPPPRSRGFSPPPGSSSARRCRSTRWPGPACARRRRSSRRRTGSPPPPRSAASPPPPSPRRARAAANRRAARRGPSGGASSAAHPSSRGSP